MSSIKILKYDLKYFDDVKKDSSYVISEDTINLIQDINKKLTILNKPNIFFEKKISNKKNIIDNWNNTKQFKPTTFVKKEGFEQNINTLRINLNKITNKNYDVLSVKILDEIDIIYKNNPENFIKIKNLFIDTVSNISIYSEIYVMIYKSIIEKYNKNLFDINENFINLKNDIQSIKISQCKINYDDFCKNNKENEKKRILTLFYINLMKNNLFSKEEILNLILDIQNYNINLINNINNDDIVSELCEYIYILIVNSFEYIKDDSKFSIISNNVIYVTKLKKNVNNSLTNKSKFKHMDILDIINNNNNI